MAIKETLRTPSAVESACTVQLAEPPAPLGMEPRFTLAVASPVPTGKLNTPVGKVTARLVSKSHVAEAIQEIADADRVVHHGGAHRPRKPGSGREGSRQGQADFRAFR